MKNLLLKLIESINDSDDKDEILEGFSENDLYPLAYYLHEWCENWPKVFEGWFKKGDNTRFLIDNEDDKEDGVEYEKSYEYLDCENFEAYFEVDCKGIEYLDVFAGGDWQDHHRFKIYKNKGNIEKPLICKDVIIDKRSEF